MKQKAKPNQLLESVAKACKCVVKCVRSSVDVHFYDLSRETDTTKNKG